MSILNKIISPTKDEGNKRKATTTTKSSPVKTSAKNTGDKKMPVKAKSANKVHAAAVKQVLLRPLISEKATFLKTFNQYVFEVHPRVNKIEIKREIKQVYKVDPLRVNVIKLSGKNVRYGRNVGKRKGWKKAVVTLKAGQSINLA